MVVCTQRALQEEADNALDMAETATAALEEEKAQLILQNEELMQQLATEADTRRASATLSQTAADDSQVLQAPNAHYIITIYPPFDGTPSSRIIRQVARVPTSSVKLPSASPVSDVQAAEDLQQLLKERDGLRELVSQQLAAATAHTARIHALEEDLQNMQNATKLAAQVVLLLLTPDYLANACLAVHPEESLIKTKSHDKGYAGKPK